LKAIHKKDLQTSKWSGGTSTTLYIYPETASYQERNFLFRISTASIEVEESVFTSLPGISRVIMVLEGEIQLHHEGQHSASLCKFDTDCFSGDWKTICSGKAIDFNLMCTGATQGNLHGVRLNIGSIWNVNSLKEDDVFGYYVYKGRLNVSTSTQIIQVNRGELLLFFNEDREDRLTLEAMADSELAVITVVIKTKAPSPLNTN